MKVNSYEERTNKVVYGGHFAHKTHVSNQVLVGCIIKVSILTNTINKVLDGKSALYVFYMH